MANNKGTRRSPYFWKNLLWKLGLLFLLLLFASQLVIIWLMGEQETADAFASGRRLVVTLEDNSIAGKIISSEATAERVGNEPVQDGENAEPPTPATTQAQPAETKDAPPQPGQEVKKEPVEEAVAVPLINEEPEEALPAMIPSMNQTAPLSEELIEKTEFGSLPKITGDGTKPWKYYSKRVDSKSNKPTIAIVVTGLGSNKKISELALRLPENINLSFSPYAPDLHALPVMSCCLIYLWNHLITRLLILAHLVYLFQKISRRMKIKSGKSWHVILDM
jgi:hypothetical protein